MVEKGFNIMTIKLVALDIDGTTLSSEGEVLPSTISAVKEARKEGVEVVFCSGRSLSEQRPFIDLLGMKYVITINGTVIRKADGKIIQETTLNPNTYSELAEYGLKRNIPFNFVDEDFNIYTPYVDIKPVIYKQAVGSGSNIYVRKPTEMNGDMHITKACFAGDSNLMDKCELDIKKKFSKEFYVVRCSQNFIEVFNPLAGKGYGLSNMTKILGVNSSEVMAIGDERNDIPMFKYAQIGVCMGNGVQQAKAAADYVTTSNDDDGISKAFNKFLFN